MLFLKNSFHILSLIFLSSTLTILLISLLTICFAKINLLFYFFLSVLANNGIPLWFRCFKGKHNPDAYSMTLIKEGLSFCANLFNSKQCHIIFLADRWFPYIDLLSHIQSLGCFYCIRTKSYMTFSFYNSKGFLKTLHFRDIKPISQHSKLFNDVLFTRKLFKTNIAISNSSTNDPWYLITNDDPRRAIKNYSHRFGSIECIFKSQKSNGFRLESTNTQKIEHFISLFTIMCISLVWLSIIGVDYSRNKHAYSKHFKIRDTYKRKNTSTSRFLSYFNLGLTIFNRCFYNYVNFTLKFDFVLYDV